MRPTGRLSNILIVPKRNCHTRSSSKSHFLPPAYVVRREGNVLTRVCPSVCPQGDLGGGYPYPIMLCNITQNSMGQTPGGGGLPCQVQPGGGIPCQVQLGGGTLPGGYIVRGRGVPMVGYPRQPGQEGGTLLGGSTQLGQQKEYSLHGGRYASCVHEGGHFCLVRCFNVYHFVFAQSAVKQIQRY